MLSAQDADGLLSTVLSSRVPAMACKYGAAFGRWRAFAVDRNMVHLPADHLPTWSGWPRRRVPSQQWRRDLML